MRFRINLWLLNLLLILSIPTLTVDAQQAIFEEADCPFREPSGVTTDCGYLTVPENYAKPDGAQIRLAIAIVRHPSNNPEPDPIIYLEGGPGGSSLEILYLTFSTRYEPLFEAKRDIIIFDQRGVGYSEPTLDCPEAQALNIELLDYELGGEMLSQDEANTLIIDSLIACGEDLSINSDLSAYNSASNAADIESLRLALGYEQINLWGISYGTRLALTAMRDYPDGIRSIVIDSVVPLEVNIYTGLPKNVARAFDMLFESCAADAACNDSYPNLREVFFDSVEKLNENPVRLNAPNPFTGEIYNNVVLNGDGLIELIFQLLYDSSSLPMLPQLIYQAAEGEFSLHSIMLGSFISQQEFISHGMHFAVRCQEEISFLESSEINEAWANYPEYEALAIDDELFDLCAAFSGASPNIENEAVVSAIPTLVTAGQFDPITPPAWAEQVAENLSNSHYIKFPYSGHGATASSDCTQDILIAFFLKPESDTLDSSCLDNMSMIYTGIAETQVDFIPVGLFSQGKYDITSHFGSNSVTRFIIELRKNSL